MFQKLKIILILSLFLIQCDTKKKLNAPKKILTVAVAANVFTTLEEIKTLFEKEQDISVELVSNSSGKLTAQITNGAPFDVFLSADMKYPETLHHEGIALNKPQIYAQGALVLWTFNPTIDLNLGLAALNSPQIQKIAIANPEAAPYGYAALEVLKKLPNYETLQEKLIFAESISQVNQYISLRSVEIGFTAKSVVMGSRLQEKGQWKEISQDLYTPIFQGVVLLNYGQKNHPQEAQAFLDFLFSSQAVEIFTRYGYLPPKE